MIRTCEHVAAMGFADKEKRCRICDSDLLLPIKRWGAWWIHCNHCGVEIPILALKAHPRKK